MYLSYYIVLQRPNGNWFNDFALLDKTTFSLILTTIFYGVKPSMLETTSAPLDA